MAHRKKISKYQPLLGRSHVPRAAEEPKGLSELPVLDETLHDLCSSSCALYPRPKEGDDRYERKIVVIDGANFIYQSSPNEDELSVLGLFSLMRMLIKYDFEVEVYLQEIYWKRKITYGVDSLHRLVHEKLIFPVPADEYDDIYYFKVAERLGGTVLSNDYFRNEMAARGHDEVYIKSYSTTVTCLDASPKKQMCMTSDGHFISRHHFLFSPLDGQFFAHHEDGLIYAISKDRNDIRNPQEWEERKIRILEALDKEIARVIDDEKRKRSSTYRKMMYYSLTEDGVNYSYDRKKDEDLLEFVMPKISDQEKKIQEAAVMEFLAAAANEKKQRKIRWQEVDIENDVEYTPYGLRIEKEKNQYVPYCLPRISLESLKMEKDVEETVDKISEMDISVKEPGSSSHLS